MPARPVLGALGLPNDVTGTLSVSAGLHSGGVSWHELAGGLTGQAGLVMTDGELDNRLLALVVGPALRVAGLAWPAPGAAAPPGGGGQGAGARTPVRCLTLRMNSVAGLAKLHDVVLDTPSLLLQGDGVLQLRDERVAFRLRPTPAGAGRHAATVRIGGVFAGTTIYPEQGPPSAPPPESGHRPDVCAEALEAALAAAPALSQP